MPTMLVLGPTSDIARAVMRAFAQDGWTFIRAGRREPYRFDATDPRSGDALWDALPCCPDAVLCAVGLLGDQEAAKHDVRLAEEVVLVNFLGLVPVLTRAADAFERRGSGLIIGVSSVAGERGRYSNYVYGSAKAGFTAFLSGLRARLCRSGVRVVTVKPGYVATRMLTRRTPAWLTATPDEVAEAVLASPDADVVFVRPVWRVVAFVARLLPEGLFKRLRY